VTPEGAVLWFNAAMSLGISLLFSMAPAWQMMKPSMNEGLRQQSASTLGGPQRFRRTAIAIQIGLSVLLLSGAGLFVRTLHNLKAQDMGLATDHLLGFAIDPSLAGYTSKESLAVQNGVRSTLAALPGVKWVGGTTDPVLAGNQERRTIQIEGYVPPPGENASAESPEITPGYLQALGVPLVAGRDVTESDKLGTQKIALVNQSFAVKYFGSPQKALGRYVGMGGSTSKLNTEIVGVVGDSKHRGVREGVVPTVYLAFAQNPELSGLQFYLRTMQAPETIENSVRVALRELDSKLVIDSMKTMDEQIDDNVSNERMVALLAVSFAFVALLTTAVGLYGVLAYATAQRTREIGIRMALGAQRFAVVRLVMMDMVKIAIIGMAVALPVSLALSRYLRSQLFEVQPFDPGTLVACVMVTVTTVIAAAALPARRAASVEPTEALRTE
jgi:predicted permease